MPTLLESTSILGIETNWAVGRAGFSLREGGENACSSRAVQILIGEDNGTGDACSLGLRSSELELEEQEEGSKGCSGKDRGDLKRRRDVKA